MTEMRKKTVAFTGLLITAILMGCARNPDRVSVTEKEEISEEATTDGAAKDMVTPPEDTKETEEREAPEVSPEPEETPEDQTDDRSYQPFTQEELDDMQYVNDAVVKLVESDDFENATASGRIVMAYDLLYELQEEGYVTNISYDNDAMLSFTYKCGISGGISTKTAEDYWIRDEDGNIIDAIN